MDLFRNEQRLGTANVYLFVHSPSPKRAFVHLAQWEPTPRIVLSGRHPPIIPVSKSGFQQIHSVCSIVEVVPTQFDLYRRNLFQKTEKPDGSTFQSLPLREFLAAKTIFGRL